MTKRKREEEEEDDGDDDSAGLDARNGKDLTRLHIACREFISSHFKPSTFIQTENNNPALSIVQTFPIALTKLEMSEMDHLAAPAPEVEEAKADRATPSAPLTVTPVAACEDATVEAVKAVEPAVTVDDPKLFAPPMTKEEASHLSVKALRRSGIEFEAKVGIKNNSICPCPGYTYIFLCPSSFIPPVLYVISCCKAAVIQGGVKKDIFRKYLPAFFDERDFVSYGEGKIG